MVSLPWWELVARLALAGALGGAIGLEREVREHQAGLRTHMLVSLGSALFTIVSAYAWGAFTFGGGIGYDPTRIAAQIVTGVGFLGAGAILHQGPMIRGLTTAATLWIVAAIGMAAGAGYWLAALVSTALVLFALEPVRAGVAPLLQRLRGDEATLRVQLAAGEGVTSVVAALENVGGTVRSLEFEEREGRREVAVEVDFPSGSRDAAVARLSEVEHVTGVHWGR